MVEYLAVMGALTRETVVSIDTALSEIWVLVGEYGRCRVRGEMKVAPMHGREEKYSRASSVIRRAERVITLWRKHPKQGKQ